VLLAKVPVGRLEPTLLPFHGLGLAPTRRRWERPTRLFLDVRRLVRLGRLVYPHKRVSLRIQLNGARLEAGNRGVKLGKVHHICALVIRVCEVLDEDGTRFFEQWLKNSHGIVTTDADLREDSYGQDDYHRG
jgi:hypothetical protein